ncbi:MAG: hypothetical protein AAFN50_03405 [Pseudomonadota bacterium]
MNKRIIIAAAIAFAVIIVTLRFVGPPTSSLPGPSVEKEPQFSSSPSTEPVNTSSSNTALPESVEANPDQQADERAVRDAIYLLKAYRSPDDSTPCAPLTLHHGKSICWDTYGFHPYLQYSPENLKPLAKDDAMAAAALAIILFEEQPEEAFRYADHASMLSGKPGPLLSWLSLNNSQMDDRQHALRMVAIAEVIADDYDLPFDLAHNYRWAVQRQHNMTNQEIDDELLQMAALGGEE